VCKRRRSPGLFILASTVEGLFRLVPSRLRNAKSYTVAKNDALSVPCCDS
jgi:hypothetical protein